MCSAQRCVFDNFCPINTDKQNAWVFVNFGFRRNDCCGHGDLLEEIFVGTFSSVEDQIQNFCGKTSELKIFVFLKMSRFGYRTEPCCNS